MRVRLLTLVVMAALAIAPMSGLACDIACRPTHTLAGSDHHGSVHAGGHDASGTSVIATSDVHHQCDHLVAVPRIAERMSQRLADASSTPTVLVSGADAPLLVNRKLIGPSPPFSPTLVSSLRVPLRI